MKAWKLHANKVGWCTLCLLVCHLNAEGIAGVAAGTVTQTGQENVSPSGDAIHSEATHTSHKPAETSAQTEQSDQLEGSAVTVDSSPDTSTVIQQPAAEESSTPPVQETLPLEHATDEAPEAHPEILVKKIEDDGDTSGEKTGHCTTCGTDSPSQEPVVTLINEVEEVVKETKEVVAEVKLAAAADVQDVGKPPPDPEGPKVEVKVSSPKQQIQTPETDSPPEKAVDLEEKLQPPEEQAPPSDEVLEKPSTPPEKEVLDQIPDGSQLLEPERPAVDQPEEEINVPKQEAEMPSFDEWKEKMLAEQAEQEKSKQLEAAQTHSNGGSGSSKKSPKSRVNYASMTCGAKTLASNPEAQYPGYILTENKDQYMIQPCKARKWFVVELCEPIQVHILELGNLELFSSLPKSFIVQISDRYPTKDWRPLGVFHARDERSVQMFAVSDQEYYSKYLRIEMQSHFGSEHYCPLSLLRVYGTTVEEDYDDSEQNEAHGEEFQGEPEKLTEEALSIEESQDKPTNLFSSATDTVLSLVKTVLSPSDKKKENQDDVAEEVVTLNGTAQNQSMTNVTAPAAPEGKEPQEMKPCTPLPSTNQPDLEQPVVGESQPAAPRPTVDRQADIDETTGPGLPSAPQTDVPVVTTETDQEEAEDGVKRGPALVTLIESVGPKLADIISHCDFHHPPHMRSHTICGYYKVMAYVYHGTCRPSKARDSGSQKPRGQKPAERKSTDGSPEFKAKPDDKKEDSVPTEAESDSVAPQTDVSSGLPDAEGCKQSADGAAVKPTPTQEITHTVPPEKVDIEPSFSDSAPGDDSATASLDEAQNYAPSENEENTEIINSTPTQTEICETDNTDAACQMGPDLAQIRPTQSVVDVVSDTVAPTQPIVGKDADEPHISETKPESVVPEAEVIVPTETTGQPVPDDASPPVVEIVSRDIYAELKSENDDLELVAVTTEGEIITKLSASKKQTTFMTLKNRIKALELNLTLSSRYLEELSQRYRRQMEEMYRSLNKTIEKLTNTSRSAEARDERQQDHISDLQNQIDRLTFSVDQLTTQMDHVHKEVVERHLFLMCIEAFVVAMATAWCLGRQFKSSRRRRPSDPAVKEVQTKEKEKAVITLPQRPLEKKKKKTHARRNSVDATPPRPARPPELMVGQRAQDDLALCSSSNDFNIVEQDLSVFLTDKPHNPELDIPKRKKKKKHQKQASYGGSPSSQQTPVDKDKDFSSDASVAGLLFAPYSHQSVSQNKSTGTNLQNRRKSDLCASQPLHSSFDAASNSSGRSKKPPVARRSLDLATVNSSRKHPAGIKLKGATCPNKENRKVTNIGPAFTNGHIKNGSINGSHQSRTLVNGTSHHDPVGPSSWKNWFPGIRK